MPSRKQSKGLFSPQESDYLQRYDVKVYGSIVTAKTEDTCVSKDVLYKARNGVSSSLYKVFLESVCLRSFLEQEAPDAVPRISRDVGRIEEGDWLISEFIKAWVPADSLESLFCHLLAFDERYSSGCRVDGWSAALGALRHDVQEISNTEVTKAKKIRILTLLGELEREIARVSTGPPGTEACQGVGEGALPDVRTQVRYDAFQSALEWLMDGRKGKRLTITYSVSIKERPDIRFTMRWDFNIPVLLLTTLTRGFPCDNETPSRPPRYMSWTTIIDLIIERFEAYDLAVIVERTSPGHPDTYEFDLVKVPKMDELGQELDISDRLDEARQVWKSRFPGHQYSEIIAVKDVSDIVSLIRGKVASSQESGAKKSVLTLAVNRMVALGLVEATEFGKGKVKITDLGRQVADYIDRQNIDEVDTIALRGHQTFPRKRREKKMTGEADK